MELPVINHPDYVAKINDDNKFPIKKFGALANHLLETNIVQKFHIPKECSIETMKTSHSLKYINDIKNKTLDFKAQKKIGFPINDSVVRRSFVATGGTGLASKLALESRLSCNTAGGSHHATFNYGAGYCVFNDTAVAANYLKKKGYAKKILILDLDVHQGDGSAACFQTDERVTTFSVHAASNFPLRKVNSDIDIPLPDGTEDGDYLAAIGDQLPDVLDQLRPQLVLFNAGVDPHRDDRLGRLHLSNDGLLMRDRLVLDACLRRKIPVATVIGGGYDNLEPLVRRHAIVFRAAAEQARLFNLA